jgi:FdhD protein
VTTESLVNADRASVRARQFNGTQARIVEEIVAVEEPLEIQLAFGDDSQRQVKSISVTMRTPGHDEQLALGFLLTEGVIRDSADVERVVVSAPNLSSETLRASLDADVASQGKNRMTLTGNAVRVELWPGVSVNSSVLQRNFYTTSSCGVCGKASLMALRSVCPPRFTNNFTIAPEVLYDLPARLRQAQQLFDDTGGIHAAAIADRSGALESVYEDVGRHNAVDKLIGAAMLEDRLPLRDRLLVLSGRASFELLQKAVMAGIPMVASVGAPSSLAVAIANDFDITLVGFLRDHHFNVYQGLDRVTASPQIR